MRKLAGVWLRAQAVLGRRLTLEDVAWGDRMSVHAAVRVLARATPVAGGDVLCRVLGRHKLLADGRDLSLTPHLALDGCWEMPLTRVLLRRLRPGMHVADVGANVGYFTVLMAAAVGPGGRVSAFEPNPGVFRRLSRNVFLNGFAERVELHAEPLGGEEGEAGLLHYDPELLGGGFVGLAPAPAGWESAPVTGRRLDALPDADALELVKIDAEGSEPRIWRGMERLVAGPRLRTVLLEWDPGAWPDASAALEDFARAGFDLGVVGKRDGIEPAGRDALLGMAGGRATMLALTR